MVAMVAELLEEEESSQEVKPMTEPVRWQVQSQVFLLKELSSCVFCGCCRGVARVTEKWPDGHFPSLGNFNNSSYVVRLR